MIMSRVLVRNGYVVTVDGAHSLSWRVRSSRREQDFGRRVIGADAQDGRIRRNYQCCWDDHSARPHQYASGYTLFKGLADGFLLEDWVTDFLLPLSLKLDALAMRVSSSQKCLKRTRALQLTIQTSALLDRSCAGGQLADEGAGPRAAIG
jgi:5-methylthioadenosine/S-adenosylhomocysteine deaminase